MAQYPGKPLARPALLNRLMMALACTWQQKAHALAARLVYILSRKAFIADRPHGTSLACLGIKQHAERVEDNNISAHHFGCEVVAYCADAGQGDETEGLEEKALKTGASKLHIVDLREEFARDFVFPMLRANAIDEGYYLLSIPIARPVIAKQLVEIAREEGAEAVAHGATGKGNY